MRQFNNADAAMRFNRPEVVAAAVNAAVMLILPLLLGVMAWIALLRNTSGSGVSAASPAWHLLANLLQLATFVGLFLPFAAIAAWRTWVYAKRYRADQKTGWAGVAEGGAVGFVAVLIGLLPAIASHPTDAPPYVAAYGGFGLLVGLGIGLILRTSAILVLRWQGQHPSRR